MKTLLFCTSYAASDETWELRYRRWLDFFGRSTLHKDQLLMIDDGSPKLPSWRGVKLLRELPERQPAEKAVLFHFADNLGRPDVLDYPGWYRSFTFAAVYARKYGFTKVVHVESDSFVFSRRMIDYLNELQTGWTTFWCPRWNFPESCIQVIGSDQLEAYAALAAVPYSGKLSGHRIEELLPFTEVRKDFVGDRFGEYESWLPDKIDFGCQIPEEWAIEDAQREGARQAPSPTKWSPAAASGPAVAAAPATSAAPAPRVAPAASRVAARSAPPAGNRAATAGRKELTVVCVSYQRYLNIPILIHSFLTQTLQNFKLLIIHDGADERMEAVLAPYKRDYPELIDYQFTAQRYNDYGHSLRDIGIRQVDTEYVLITNDDNYYCPRFLEYMFGPVHAQTPRPDIVMCDMVHSHNQPGGRPQPPYRFFETYPQNASVDIGCFIARSALAKQAGFRDKGFDGDATYFEDLVRVAGKPRIVKVDHVLFVHN